MLRYYFTLGCAFSVGLMTGIMFYHEFQLFLDWLVL